MKIHPILLIAALCAVSSASAQVVTVPPGLAPGESYRLVFVTERGHNAFVRPLSFFNDFVTGEANAVPALAALGTTWKAILSNGATSAATNSETSPSGAGQFPIYRLDGALVAGSYGQFWSGGRGYNGPGVPLHDQPISITESGTVFQDRVWTGSFANGDGAFYPTEAAGGNMIGGNGLVTYGYSHAVDASWVTVSADSASYELPFYAISGVLTATPEPGSAALLCAGAAALLGWRRRIA